MNIKLRQESQEERPIPQRQLKERRKPTELRTICAKAE